MGVLNDDGLISAQRVRDRVLLGVEDGLTRLRGLYFVMSTPTHTIGLLTSVQHKFGTAATPIPWKKYHSIYPYNFIFMQINKGPWSKYDNFVNFDHNRLQFTLTQVGYFNFRIWNRIEPSCFFVWFFCQK